MGVVDLAATVTIGGESMAGYIRKITRDSQLCHPGQKLEITLSQDAPRTNLNPWETVVITERGTTTFTGYVDKIAYKRPSKEIVVYCTDTYKRATAWFVSDPLETDEETAAYWVDYMCDLCGLSYSIVYTEYQNTQIIAGIQIGLKHVSEVLEFLCSIGRWCMRVTSLGVLEFLPTSQPETADYTLSEFLEYEIETNDYDTRNVAKIWGYGPLTYTESRAVSGIVEDRIMVFADPSVDTLAKAQALADAALDQFANIRTIGRYKIPGLETMQVGDVAYTVVTTGSYIDTITDLKVTLDDNEGYYNELTTNRRCFRLPYFPLVTPGSTPEPPEPPKPIPSCDTCAYRETFWVRDMTYANEISGGAIYASDCSYVYQFGETLTGEIRVNQISAGTSAEWSTELAATTATFPYYHVVSDDNFVYAADMYTDTQVRLTKLSVLNGAIATTVYFDPEVPEGHTLTDAAIRSIVDSYNFVYLVLWVKYQNDDTLVYTESNCVAYFSKGTIALQYQNLLSETTYGVLASEDAAVCDGAYLYLLGSLEADGNWIVTKLNKTTLVHTWICEMSSGHAQNFGSTTPWSICTSTANVFFCAKDYNTSTFTGVWTIKKIDIVTGVGVDFAEMAWSIAQWPPKIGFGDSGLIAIKYQTASSAQARIIDASNGDLLGTVPVSAPSTLTGFSVVSTFAYAKFSDSMSKFCILV